jgi:hypothetical protein
VHKLGCDIPRFAANRKEAHDEEEEDEGTEKGELVPGGSFARLGPPLHPAPDRRRKKRTAETGGVRAVDAPADAL